MQLENAAKLTKDTVIKTIIKRSEQIIQLKKTDLLARQLQIGLNNCPIVFAYQRNEELTAFRIEIRLAIDERQRVIANMLRPIMGPYGIIIEDKFWLSKGEIIDGFILFTHPKEKRPSHVLFLKDFIDTFDGEIANAGLVYPYRQVHHILSKYEANRLLEKQMNKTKRNESQNSDTECAETGTDIT